jgi:hypothetical protein
MYTTNSSVWQWVVPTAICLTLLMFVRLLRGQNPKATQLLKPAGTKVAFVESDGEEIIKFRQKLTGTWRLSAYLYKLHGPVTVTQYPHGKHAIGQLIYTSDGHMSVHIMEPGCPPFKGTRPHRGTQEEMAKACFHYQAYAGEYRVGYDLDNQIMLKHVVDMALYPNWVGGDQFRIAKMSDDELILTPETLHKWKVGDHCRRNGQLSLHLSGHRCRGHLDLEETGVFQH